MTTSRVEQGDLPGYRVGKLRRVGPVQSAIVLDGLRVNHDIRHRPKLTARFVTARIASVSFVFRNFAMVNSSPTKNSRRTSPICEMLWIDALSWRIPPYVRPRKSRRMWGPMRMPASGPRSEKWRGTAVSHG